MLSPRAMETTSTIAPSASVPTTGIEVEGVGRTLSTSPGVFTRTRGQAVGEGASIPSVPESVEEASAGALQPSVVTPASSRLPLVCRTTSLQAGVEARPRPSTVRRSARIGRT